MSSTDQSFGSAGPAWADLTDAQRYILYEAGTGGRTLTELLNGWVDGEDGRYWNRKGAYVVPLAQAAQSLVETGLVEVSAEPVGEGEGGLMLREDAAAAVGDPGNWWQYDPEANWDPNEDLSRYAEFEDCDSSPSAVIYSVASTDPANELGLIRWPWWLGSTRPHGSADGRPTGAPNSARVGPDSRRPGSAPL